MFSVLFCSFREIFCGFRMSTGFLFLLKRQQSKAGVAVRRWVCLWSLPLPSAAVFILDTCGPREVQAEASLPCASNRCEMALVGEVPRQARLGCVGSVCPVGLEPLSGCWKGPRLFGVVMSVVFACSVVLAGGSCRPHCLGYVQWVANPGSAPEPVWVEKSHHQPFSRGVGRMVLPSHPLHL